MFFVVGGPRASARRLACALGYYILSLQDCRMRFAEGGRGCGVKETVVDWGRLGIVLGLDHYTYDMGWLHYRGYLGLQSIRQQPFVLASILPFWARIRRAWKAASKDFSSHPHRIVLPGTLTRYCGFARAIRSQLASFDFTVPHYQRRLYHLLFCGIIQEV